MSEEYRELLELIQECGAAGAAEPESLRQTVNRVTAWAVRHFAAEDALTRDADLNPEAVASRRREHDDLLDQLQRWRPWEAARDASDFDERLATVQSSLAIARAREAANETHYRALLAALPVGVVVQEVGGRIVLSNAAAERILGLTEEQLATRTSADPRWQAVDETGQPLPGNRHPAMVALATGQAQRDVTMGLRKPDGSLIWISACADVLASQAHPDARPLVVSSFMDITARKRFEDALCESRQQLDLVLERTGTGIWDWDFESGEVRFSPGWYTMLGYAPDELPASVATWDQLVHPDDRAGAWEAINRLRSARDDGPPYDLVFRMRTKCGQWRCINSRAAVVRRNAQGLPARLVGTHVDLTEERESERALFEEQRKLAGLFKIAPIGIAMAVDRVLIEVNDTLCRLTGYSRAELVGRDTRFLYSDQGEYERAALFKYRNDGPEYGNEVDVRWVRKDGVLIDVVLNATYLDRREPRRGITFTVLDMTERRRIAAALRESEETYRLAMEATQDGVWDWNVETGIVRYSPAWGRIVKAQDVPAHYDSWAERVHPDDWPDVERSLQKHLAGGCTLWQKEHRLRLPNGDWKWVLGRGRVVKRDLQGHPLRMVGTMIDIDERKAAERERAVLSDTLEASLNEIYLFDAETLRFRYANQGARSNLGYSMEALRALTPLDLKPQVTPESFQALVAPLLSGQRAVQVFEGSHRRADGSLYPVEVHLQLFRQEGDGVYLAVIQDITERKRSEASLQASEQRFRFWVEATESVFWMADRSGALVEPSPSLERLTGMSRECCLGHGRLAAIHPDDREGYAAELGRAVALGEAFELQLRYWDAAAGAYRWYLERGVPHRASDGSIQGWLGAGVSIDRQKRAEAAQQDMMRRKDEFIAMLGHELRNPLAPIQNANDILGAVAGNDSTLQWVHGMVGRHAAHLIRLVDDLLDVGRLLSGKIALQPEPIAVVTLLRQLAESHAPEIKARGQQLHLSLPEETVVIPGDPVRLTQVFDNLLNNAIRYTPEGGHIWLEAAAKGGQAVVRVRDSGIGIPGDLLPHIFDPFAQGQRDLDRSEGGLGIGLTVARQLAVLHHGDIEARSVGVDRGSEFIVRLPLGDRTASRGAAESAVLEPAEEVPLRPLRVLIVDDNVDAAQSLTLLLEYFGIAVQTAADGAQGLELARGDSPDLILLDIGLPGMDGFEVARRLRQMEATQSARIIAVTGYAQPEYRVRARKAGFDGYLVKPIRLDQIRDLVDSFSEGPGPSSPQAPGFVAPKSRTG